MALAAEQRFPAREPKPPLGQVRDFSSSGPLQARQSPRFQHSPLELIGHRNDLGILPRGWGGRDVFRLPVPLALE